MFLDLMVWVKNIRRMVHNAGQLVARNLIVVGNSVVYL